MIAIEENTGSRLRKICFVIGYLHLASSVLDIVFHLLTVAIVTSGFQCDVSYDTFNSIPWTMVEPILLVLNLGTHGFYPFPGIFRRQYNMYAEFTSIAAEPKCYPGMLHVYLVDVLNFLINMIWLKIVITYIGALHKKNPEPMRMFFSLSLVKIVMQVMYFGYQPQLHEYFAIEAYWFLKVMDIFVAVVFLVIVRKYTKILRFEKASEGAEKPPSYIECLINASVPSSPVRQDDVIIFGITDETKAIDEKKPPEEELKKDKRDSVP